MESASADIQSHLGACVFFCQFKKVWICLAEMRAN